MDIEFWGVRGTAPVSGREYLKYGGRTPCVSVVSSKGEVIIIDAGTGIKRLGERLMAGQAAAELHLHLLLTHFHLDHLIGLPFFLPLYSARVTITFISPLSPLETEKHFSGLMGGRYFPVAFKETASAKVLKRIGDETMAVGSFTVRSSPLHHPQGSVAYRVEEGESSLVMATDTEPPDGQTDERLASFASRAGVFVYDATFTPDEYLRRQGWGHSTWLEGTRLARQAKVGRLILSHLNPDHSDRQVDEMVSLARREFRRASAGREGLRLKI
ncbi:MAG: MBL fold metallo-hydrolase [Clostridiales bacterium]|nr:MBL fold metallo-hydrolase [Clostridiales bacterium]